MISWKILFISNNVPRSIDFCLASWMIKESSIGNRLTLQLVLGLAPMDARTSAFTLLLPYCLETHLSYDDVIKWEHFPRNWPFVRGIHRSPVNAPHKGQWCGALMFYLICVWINDSVNNREAGDLRRYRDHYDVIVMLWSVLEGSSSIKSLQALPWIIATEWSIYASVKTGSDNALVQIMAFHLIGDGIGYKITPKSWDTMEVVKMWNIDIDIFHNSGMALCFVVLDIIWLSANPFVVISLLYHGFKSCFRSTEIMQMATFYWKWQHGIF